MFFSNLAAILKRDADTQILAWEQKHRYQANRSYLLNRIKAKIIPLLQASISLCKRMIIQLIEKASKVRSILRPNRTFGRYRTHTRRRYYNHMETLCVKNQSIEIKLETITFFVIVVFLCVYLNDSC